MEPKGGFFTKEIDLDLGPEELRKDWGKSDQQGERVSRGFGREDLARTQRSHRAEVGDGAGEHQVGPDHRGSGRHLDMNW